MMDRNVLSQYLDIKIEIEKMQKDIKKAEDNIAKLIEEGTVVDKVTGGEGGWQGFKIEGFPIKEYNRRRELLKSKVYRLKTKENDLLSLENAIEEFIDSIPNSRDRQIFQKSFLEGMAQQEIAEEMYLERSSISKTISKYV